MLHIAPADDGQVGIARSLWTEYWESMGLAAEFQNFDEEMRSLPGAYASPKGRLLIAWVDGEPAGAIAFRPLSDEACEAKRLYVRPQYRRMRIGRALLDRLIDEARAAGYREMFADTLKFMTAGIPMYHDAGFHDIEPYTANPTPGAIFFKLLL